MNEVQEGVTSQHEMVQYHALSLLYQIKAHDRLAISKLVRKFFLKGFPAPLSTYSEYKIKMHGEKQKTNKCSFAAIRLIIEAKQCNTIRCDALRYRVLSP